MMKTLIVFYSRTKNTKKLGKEIAKKLKADIDEIIDLKNRSGILGFIFAGFDALFKRKTKIKFNKDPSKYSLIIIGTPIWAGTITPAIRTYLLQNKNKFKELGFFCTYGSDPKKYSREMQRLSKKPLATLEIIDKDVRINKTRDKIEEFLKKLKKK